jgi:DNA adenine methylase
MKPLLKWVGSKRWISRRIANIVREDILTSGKYHEPFVGAGSVLFELSDLENNKIASDIVEPLIETYRAIQQNPIGVWGQLHKLNENGLNKEEYNLRRDIFNKGQQHSLEEWIALFIYLNHSCYNALWRTNKDGDFNVPFGDHANLRLPDQADFLRASQSLQNTSFTLISHPRQVLVKLFRSVKGGDVVFVDPPYLNTFDGYDEYTHNTTKSFHEELACILWNLNIRGATIIAMNSNCDEIQKWYGAFCDIEIINRHQNVSGTNSGRGTWDQVLAIAR